jgi:2-methylisocitrate lyase-like PEP mutase family enzyme
MRRICTDLPGWKMANMVEGGDTPVLTPTVLAEIGYHHAAFPLTLMSAAMRAMCEALEAFKAGHLPEGLMPFGELRSRVGFDAYYEIEAHYAGRRDLD